MKKEKKSSIFWILIIFFVLFSIWQLWVPEALDDWRWGSEVGIMRLKTWFEGYNGRYFGDILVIVLTRLPIVLRSMAISGIMTAMLYLIYQLTEYKILSFLICIFFVVNIPTSLIQTLQSLFLFLVMYVPQPYDMRYSRTSKMHQYQP